jgi:hypothetical protein
MKIHNPDPKNSKGKPTERFLFRYFVKSGILGILAALFSILPTNAAERVYLSFASANVSVSVKALEVYAKEGIVNDAELQRYLLLLSLEDQQQFRNLLLESYKFDPLMVSQFLNSPTGEIFLDKLGDLIQAKLNEKGTITLRNGSDAIRTAFIEAAQDPEGLTPLNILHYFPSEGIQVNTQLLFELRDQFQTLSKETEAVIAKVVKLSTDEIALEPFLDYTQKPDIRQPGPYIAV